MTDLVLYERMSFFVAHGGWAEVIREAVQGRGGPRRAVNAGVVKDLMVA